AFGPKDQPEVLRVVSGESRVAAGSFDDLFKASLGRPRAEILGGFGKALKADCRDLGEKGGDIFEMMRGGGVRDPGAAGAAAKGEAFDAVLGEFGFTGG